MGRILHTSKDIAEENSAAWRLALAWDCSLNRYPQMARIDWFISRGDSLVAFAEMKRRYVNHDTYQTVYLSFAKWCALIDASVSASCSAMIVYVFNDGIWFADASDIDPRAVKILGRKDRDDVETDLEPIIEVPVSLLKQVKEKSVPTHEEWIDAYNRSETKAR